MSVAMKIFSNWVSSTLFSWVTVVACMGAAQASVIISSGTRVVYQAEEREATVKLKNDNTVPAAVQVWLDVGDERAKPDQVQVPFTLTPPLFRLEPGKSQAIRMAYTGEKLPANKESLFWLNVLEVPPTADNGGHDMNAFQLALRTRIKVFYRPENLKGNAKDAAAEVSWKISTGSDKALLLATNPTPYYVSYDKVVVKAGEVVTPIEGVGGMVAPGGSTTFTLGNSNMASAQVVVQYDWINDSGQKKAGEYGVENEIKTVSQ